MLFKREHDYGIRIIRSLKAGDKIPVKQICRMEDIPEAFAYKILKKMQVAGLLSIDRGAQGGCFLAKDLETITLYDIILSIEPDFSLIPCMHHDCSKNTEQSPCRVHCELSGIQQNLTSLLRARSMADILSEPS